MPRRRYRSQDVLDMVPVLCNSGEVSLPRYTDSYLLPPMSLLCFILKNSGRSPSMRERGRVTVWLSVVTYLSLSLLFHNGVPIPSFLPVQDLRCIDQVQMMWISASVQYKPYRLDEKRRRSIAVVQLVET